VEAMGQEDEKDPKRAHVVLSQGREVVGPGYSKLSSAATMETNKGRRSDNLNRVTRVGDGWPGIPNWVIRVNSREQQRQDYLGHVGWVSNTEQEQGSTSRVASTEQLSVNTENWAENRKKENVVLQARNQLHGGAQGVLPRHKGADYRRCVKRSWQRRRRRNNGAFGLTIYGP
jgi:hypothetical protein